MKNFINKHKRRLALGIIAISLLTLTTANSTENIAYAAADDNKVTVLVNGKSLGADKPAYIVNNRTVVPLRAVSEELGAKVLWDDVNRAVDIIKDNKTVRLYIDNRLVRYSEDNIVGSSTRYDVSDVAPIIIGNSTYVPLRLVSNALGLETIWNEAKRQVTVSRSETVKTEKYFNIEISNIKENQVISDITTLTLSGTESLPSNAAQLRYLFLDPVTGKGKIVASTEKVKEPVTLKPDINNQGSGVLAAVVYDKNGNFLAGTTKPISIQINPKIALKGVTANQTIKSAVSLSSDLNFVAAFVQYEIIYSGKSTPELISKAEIDPDGSLSFSPAIEKNGPASIRVIAYDVYDKPYAYSEYINVNIAIEPAKPQPPFVTLASFTTKNVGIVPVKLAITRNFAVSKTQYYAKNVNTGEVKLLNEVPWGDYDWLPGPDMAGTWDVYVVCIKPNGEKVTSNTRRVTISDKESLVINGIGPKQVITGEFSISSTANVPIKEVSYIISNPFNGTQAVLGTATDTSKLVTYTPRKVNEGVRNIQAIATTANGKTLKSEVVEVKFYFGELYSAQPLKINGKPISTTAEFIELVTPMALENQKQNGMSAALKVAQAAIESGWGKSIPVDRYSGLFSNNLFGIKGTGSAGSVLIKTREEYYGTSYYIDDYFRAYKSIQESFNDHTALLTEKERYIPYKEVMFNSTAAAHALKRCGYATDSSYASNIILLIRKYGLDKLDHQGI